MSDNTFELQGDSTAAQTARQEDNDVQYTETKMSSLPLQASATSEAEEPNAKKKRKRNKKKKNKEQKENGAVENGEHN